MAEVNVKKIYKEREALVSDDLINKSDSEIDDAIVDVSSGMIIYNAGKSVMKQRSLDGRWVLMQVSGAKGEPGADGKSAYEIAKELHPEIGNAEEWIASLKGEKGDAGKDGATGEKGNDGKDGSPGKDGKGVKSITLKTDADGKVIGGTIAFTDDTSAQIAISTEMDG